MDASNSSTNRSSTPHGSVREGNFLKARGDNIEEAEKDIDQMIEKSGCAQIYYKLEECMGENDRDWRKCQNEVRLLKQCSDLKKQLKQ